MKILKQLLLIGKVVMCVKVFKNLGFKIRVKLNNYKKTGNSLLLT